MISTTTAEPSRTVGAAGEQVTWRCLARRGMLHSECESIDHVRLAAHTEFGPNGTLLLDAHFPLHTQSYRSFRFPWTGAP